MTAETIASLNIALNDVEPTATRQIEVPLANEVAMTYWPVKEPPHHE